MRCARAAWVRHAWLVTRNLRSISIPTAERPNHRTRLAFDAGHMRTAARKRQREIAEAAKQVEYAVGWLRIEQAECMVDHAPVHAAVDLDEVERKKLQLDLVGRQTERQPRIGGPQRRNAVDTAGLHKNAEAIRLAEFDQRLRIR